MPARLIITGIEPGMFAAMQQTYGPPRVVDNQIRWTPNTIEIDYNYNDFLEKHRTLQSRIRTFTGKPDRPAMMEAFATDFYKNEQATQLNDTRDHYRNSVKPPSVDPGLNPGDTQQAATTKCLNGKDGMCLGNKHNDENSKAMLCDMLDDNSLTGNGVGMVFIEEFKTWAQPMLNDYLSKPPGTPMPKELEDYLDGINKGFWKQNVPPKNFKTLVEKAQAKRVKIYGIDSGEADPGVDNQSALHPERRVALMNKVAEDVMRQAMNDNPGQKFIAMVGGAHMNSHDGGIPGLAQIFDIPSVVLDQNDKLTFVPDDPTKHTMPSKEEQAFIEKFIEQIEAKQGGPPQQSQDPHDLNKPFDPNYKVAMRRLATKQAADLKQQGQLNALTDVDTALKSAKVVQAIDDRAKFNKLDQRAQAVEEQLKKMSGPEVADLLRDDPRLVGTLGLDPTVVTNVLNGTFSPEALLVDYHDKKAVANANTQLLKEPNYGTMDDNQKQTKLQELTKKARFDIAKEAFLQPYVSIRTAIVNAEQNFTQTNAREGTDPERTRQHQAKIAALNEQLKQCRANTETFVDNYVNTHPEILQERDKDNMSLLSFAAIQVNGPMMDTIAGMDPGLVNALDSRGKAPVHYALERRDFLDPTLRNDLLDAQSQGLTELMKHNANLNLQNGNGETPLHLAALNGNTDATQTLLRANVQTNITDNRNWTAYDVCLVSTKPEVEQVFYAENKASPNFVMPNPPNQSVVDILMKATLIEDNTQQARDDVLAMYEKMYADENLRPILEAAAVDAMQDRDPPNEGGVRIGVANGNSTGRLYNAPQWYPGGEGGYDEQANSFLLAGKPDPGKIKEGTLIHEMTHMITRKMYGTDTVPYDNDQDKEAYKTAIGEDVKNMHLMNDSNPTEARIKQVMSERLKTYANRGGDDQLLQEFIVGIPQLIAEFGADMVQKCAPNLMRYYKQFTDKVHHKMTNDPQYQNLHGQIDNAALDLKLTQNPPKLPKAPEDWLPQNSPDLTVDGLMDKIKAEYKIRHGHANLPNGATIPYSAGVYELYPNEEGLFDAKMGKIRLALEKSLASGGLGRELSPESVRTLVLETMNIADKSDMRQLGDIEEAVTGNATNWARDSKVRYVNHQMDLGQFPEETELAEAILLMAEDSALIKLGNGDPNLAVEVDPKKHKALVEFLAQDLRKRMGKGISLTEVKAAMKQLAKSMVDSPKSPFKVKKKAAPGQLDVDKKDLRKAWLQKLATI